jgi:DNA-binding response OmpR family regulator
VTKLQARDHVRPQARKCRALVVEDDALTHASLRRMLETCGHEVEAVGTVAEAYPRLADSGCVVVDLQLPDGCGIDVLRYVRERHLPVRVAINTGCADQTLLREVRALRPDALFIKPFNPEKLLAWIAATPA